MVRFDAYTATTNTLKAADVIPWFFEGHVDHTLHQGRGFHTFGERIAVKNHAGDEIGSVSFGGRQGDRIMVEVKGERTPELVERLRASGEHRCTRVDSCVDFERPGAFEALLDPVMRAKADFKLYGERRGDWEFPELGRTQYLGANSSTVRLRLYEKGKQPEFRHLNRPDLARMEVQIRPAKDAKTEYSQLSALEVWGASKWTRQLAAEVLESYLDPVPPGTVRKDTELTQKVRWLCKQYGPTLMKLASDLGSWECVGLQLRDEIQALKRRGGA